MAKIAVLGSGDVGEALSNGFLKYGHEVRRGSREPKKLQAWCTKAGSKASVGTFEDAAAFGTWVVLAVKGSVAEALVKNLAKHLAGKPVMDTTNPIGDAPPVHGVLSFFTGPNDSLMERLQRAAPDAHFVKVFSSVGSPLMVNPKFNGGTPTMFICGNNAGAKKNVQEVLTQFGWETADMGPAEAARAIEPLCMLWCIPGLVRQEWSHAFKLLKG